MKICSLQPQMLLLTPEVKKRKEKIQTISKGHKHAEKPGNCSGIISSSTKKYATSTVCPRKQLSMLPMGTLNDVRSNGQKEKGFSILTKLSVFLIVSCICRVSV